jgi:hypothetical protein
MPAGTRLGTAALKLPRFRSHSKQLFFVLVLGSQGSNFLKIVENNVQIVLDELIQLICIDLSFFRLQAVRVEVADHGVRALAFSLRGVAVGQWAAVSHLPFEGKLKKMKVRIFDL